MDFNSAAYYVAGLFDGEGSVLYLPTLNKERGTRVNRCVRIDNNDRGLIEALQDCLDVLGVEWKEYKNRVYYTPAGEQRISYRIAIHRKASLTRFLEVVPFFSAPKRYRLESLVAEWPTERKIRKDKGQNRKGD